MARIKQRSTEQECLLFHATEVLGLRIAKRISYASGESGIANGTLQYCYIDDDCVGYQMCDASTAPKDYVELPASGAITAAEMMLYAGRHFKDGRSHTEKLTEDQRLNRLWPEGTLTEEQLLAGKCYRRRNGRPPTEDAIERVTEKVNAFGEARLVAG